MGLTVVFIASVCLQSIRCRAPQSRVLRSSLPHNVLWASSPGGCSEHLQTPPPQALI